MFAVIYQFEVKPNEEDKFISAWEGLTKQIYELEGSLGSRLHKNQNGNFIAYAQWPDKNTWENAAKLRFSSMSSFSTAMKESCISITTLFELDETADLLRNSVFNSEL